jgi:hypothetical protein
VTYTVSRSSQLRVLLIAVLLSFVVAILIAFVAVCIVAGIGNIWLLSLTSVLFGISLRFIPNHSRS